ncbi:dihydrolipoamide acetyltransferase [soil metagenome]
MAIEVVMPRLGWTMETGTVVEWLKTTGESVEAGDMLLAVESDKAITEVEALDSGIVYVPPNAPIGIEVPVGATLGFILAPGEAQPESGLLFSTTTHQASEPERSMPTGQWPANSQHTEASTLVAVSPRARRIAADLGVDLNLVTGTGRGNRIREADVRAAAPASGSNSVKRRVSPTVERIAAEAGLDLADVPSTRPSGRVVRADLIAARSEVRPKVAPMTAFRRATSERMTASARTTAPVTLTTEVDATELVLLREWLKDDNANGTELDPAYSDLLIRLTAQALKRHLYMNATIDEHAIVVHDNINIGIAVDTDRGLLVPVVSNADQLSVYEIARKSSELIDSTRSGTIGREQLAGGTFTLTNLGMYGIDAFTPIINLPESAVLGVGRILAKPVVVDEQSEEIKVRKMMALSLTFDHRVVDGAPAARFLQHLSATIESPYRWLLS